MISIRSIIIALFFFSCLNADTIAQNKLQADSVIWKPLMAGLYINSNGDIAFKMPYAKREGDETGYLYYTHFDFDDSVALNTVIDTATFHQLNYAFYKDKNHIYQYFAMAGGGRFSVFEAIEPSVDYTTFKVLNEYYAKDKNHVYDSRMGLMQGVDASSFKVFGEHPIAKDKSHYYQWSDTITLQQLKEWIKEIEIKGL